MTLSAEDLSARIAAKKLQPSHDFDIDEEDEVGSESGERRKKKPSEPKQAELVIREIENNCQLFHDAKGTAYAKVGITNDGKMRDVIFRLKSKGFGQWCAAHCRSVIGRSVGSSAIDEAIQVLTGIAVFDRPEQTTFIRAARIGECVYIDLGDATGDAIEVTAGGWRTVDSCPAYFIRSPALRPLPRPVVGGDVRELRRFINVRTEDEFALVLGWLLGAIGNQGRPNPPLFFQGEQGSSKTTTARMVRGLVDPSLADVRRPPRDEDTIAVAAQNSYVLTYDNLSGIDGWLSDALCVVTTGGALTKRTLYSDSDEEVLELLRPLLATGIDDLAQRADLAERAIALTLEPIDRSKRRSEREIWADFDTATPRIFGALLDGIAHGLGYDGPRVDELDRMADWLTWVSACEEGIGLARGTMIRAYRGNRGSAVNANLDASPIATTIRELLALPDYAGKWEGTVKALLDRLSSMAGETTKKHRTWPKLPNLLSQELRRVTPFLRDVGIEIETHRSNKGSMIALVDVRKRPSPTPRPKTSGLSGDDDSSGTVTDAEAVTVQPTRHAIVTPIVTSQNHVNSRVISPSGAGDDDLHDFPKAALRAEVPS